MAEKKGTSSEKTLYCSFCGKSQHEVKKLIAGPSVFVCDECIELCNEIIRDELPAGTVAKDTKGELPTPAEIEDERAPFGDRNEVRRTDQSVAGLVPPHQRLGGVHLTGRQRHDRLEVEFEFLVANAVAERQREVGLAEELALQFRIEPLDPSSPALLGEVERGRRPGGAR